MKATEAKLLEFLKKSPQFIIPIYQRTYSWTKRECEQLWQDIIRTGENDDVYAHFIGSIVYIEKGIYQVSSQSPLLVIDGQQRLTTITLLLEALARYLEEKNISVQDFSADKIRFYYLLNQLEEGDRGFKLLLTQTDKQTLLSLLKQLDYPTDHSIRVKQNFEYFTTKIKALDNDLSSLYKGLLKLIVVDIALSRDQDNPQLIFESMNSTGKELSQADLIRNYILMGLEPKHQTLLYEKYWRPMELSFGQEAYGIYFDSFMRHYLTIKTGEIPNIGKVYSAFKEFSKKFYLIDNGIEKLVSDINRYASFYCAMALGKESDEMLKIAFDDLRDLRVEVSYPLLLDLYSDYYDEILSKDNFLLIIRLIESYVFRRVICSIPTNSLNKTFATFSKEIKKEKYLESVRAQFQNMQSYRRFPNDKEFKRELKTRDIYHLRTRSYFLRKLENFNRKEKVYIDEYTIEHIMPQNENLSDEWKYALGENWKSIQDEWLHTIGNLTLTGYNSEYSDKPFPKKRDMEGGFKQSPLKLNRNLGFIDDWNEQEIINRARLLIEESLLIWDSPKLPESILVKYKKKDKIEKDYTIDDHGYLSEISKMRPIFDMLRREILALSPLVREEFLKLYVAYKAETNFVDIVPQSRALLLSINISINELNDSKGICRDVSNMGRWGNGEVEFHIREETEIPYAIGLIRQSLEKQMDNGN